MTNQKRRLPIRMSNWTMVHHKKKSDVIVVKDILVKGEVSDIPSIKKNWLYLGRVYRDMYGKNKWQKKRQEMPYLVREIELDDKILGYGYSEEEQVRKQES